MNCQTHEIDIGDRWIGSVPLPMQHRDGSWEVTPAGKMISAAEVLRQIEAHRQAGARCLLVTLGMCGGGALGESLEIVAGLRRFSTEVGPVVAHVQGTVGSSGPLIAIAADLVIMAPKARMLFHAASCGQAHDPEATHKLVPHFAARCAASEEEVLRWLSHGLPGSPEPVIIADAEAAIAHGLADLVGELGHARALAAALGAGMPLFETPRGAFLRQLAAAPAPATELLRANALRTSDYAEDGSGDPIAGAQMLANTALTAWAANTAYSVGDKRSNGGRLYQCSTAGTSAGGAAAWASGTTYGAAALVSYSGRTYYSLQAGNTNHQPNTSPTWWQDRGANTGPADLGSAIWDGTVKWETYSQLRVGPSGIRIGTKTMADLMAPEWIPITPNANWTASGSFPPAYSIGIGNVVRMRGWITAAAGAVAPAFTLPAGFRPAVTRSFMGVNTETTWKLLVVEADGDVTFGGSWTTGDNLNLDAIHFAAEQ
ncbi:MAG: hypothetical protein HZB56_23840 [Deltaproteobacteria bacterium]|nr:hypothetical protein [Deltaproteobacteria bacterium]